MTSPVLLRRFAAALLLAPPIAGCGRGGGPRVFEQLSPDETGISFANTITTTDSVNVQSDVYVYNGAGVGVGDIDNDGLADVFLAGNMVSSRLYLNRGRMRFEDITRSAGVETTRWATGVALVDVNADGWLDIHVSVSGPEWSRPADRANLLFINNRDRTFTESAARYGIADTGFTTQSAFLDFDGDGCLDVFLLNNSPKDFSRADVARQPAGVRASTPDSYNQLYRNGCDGTFTNVSDRAGILRTPGYGLGVAVSDLNRDGRPDIYVSNDAAPNDVVYVNNGDGTFTDRAGRWLRHASVAGMGVDAADFNDDGWPDILQVDMLPRDLARRKRTGGYLTWAHLQESRSRGFRDDFSLNTLQLSNGLTREGDVVFSEIARLAGVSATDWSWSALFADFDNDGRKDIFIGNGYPKAVNDLDYVYAALAARARERSGASRRAALELLAGLPPYRERNYVFRNRGDLTFEDRSAAWGFAEETFAYGAAYADLDNDGRLDLVVNNIDAPASVLRNVGPGKGVHHLRVRLEGEGPNRRGFGTTLVLSAGGRRQYLYQSPQRGYMSSVDDRLHFGLGAAARVDSLEVLWPDGRYQLLTALEPDRELVVRQRDAVAREPAAREPAAPPAPAPRVFEPFARGSGLAHRPGAGTPLDFGVQPLLPYMVSRRGPPLAVGDVDGDGLDDVFIGGGQGTPARLLRQRADGTFADASGGQPWTGEAMLEDWGACLFDANGDGALDLYVATGGYHAAPGSETLQDRLYLNDGRGRFARAVAALPRMLTSTAAVRAADFDGDGRLDLFVGGRLTPRGWPKPTRSYILRNEGGRFADVTAEVLPALAADHGMITDAAWIDFDGDGRLDLVTVGEWLPIEFYRNDGARFHNVTAEMKLPPLRGWWYSLAVGDLDRDGRPDLVAGNLGLNSSWSASRQSPAGVLAGDFTGNRATDVVLTQRIDGAWYPLGGLAPLGREIYPLGLRYPTYGSFAGASIEQLFDRDALGRALHLQADTFASVALLNDGAGRFRMSALPSLAQIAPIRAIAIHDVDGDGNADAIVAGNLYETEPNTPRIDAGNGLWLRGDGTGRLRPVPAAESGFLAPLDATGLALVRTRTGVGIIVANAGDSLQAYTIRKP